VKSCFVEAEINCGIDQRAYSRIEKINIEGLNRVFDEEMNTREHHLITNENKVKQREQQSIERAGAVKRKEAELVVEKENLYAQRILSKVKEELSDSNHDLQIWKKVANQNSVKKAGIELVEMLTEGRILRASSQSKTFLDELKYGD